MPYVIQPMQLEDVDEVSRVERQCFTTPWPASAYRREIRENRLGSYIVLRWIDADADQREIDTTEPEENNGPVGVLRAFSNLLRPLGVQDRGERRRSGEIVGFAGMWLMFDEAHITTIGVLPALRGFGLGEYLLIHTIEVAQQRQAKRVTLEVRVSNEAAQALYRKYTFKEEGVRKRYYSDDGEDALIMWSDRIDDSEFLRRFGELREASFARVRHAPPPMHARSRTGR
ncbi:MAG TPA: ribosomal protein S18-alanine N-acetyltransferase [Chloroflexota bacterium]|nr:ribosomal protein S18-alanine N-acetyltransferase [Chloroflexota bacterium]